MEAQQQISAERLQEKVGREILRIIDEVDEEGAIVAAWQMHRKSTARFISMVNQRLRISCVWKVEHADEHTICG